MQEMRLVAQCSTPKRRGFLRYLGHASLPSIEVSKVSETKVAVSLCRLTAAISIDVATSTGSSGSAAASFVVVIVDVIAEHEFHRLPHCQRKAASPHKRGRTNNSSSIFNDAYTPIYKEASRSSLWQVL
jgi:hypothetical protein